jgi:hypothetical protein
MLAVVILPHHGEQQRGRKSVVTKTIPLLSSPYFNTTIMTDSINTPTHPRSSDSTINCDAILFHTLNADYVGFVSEAVDVAIANSVAELPNVDKDSSEWLTQLLQATYRRNLDTLEAYNQRNIMTLKASGMSQTRQEKVVQIYNDAMDVDDVEKPEELAIPIPLVIDTLDVAMFNNENVAPVDTNKLILETEKLQETVRSLRVRHAELRRHLQELDLAQEIVSAAALLPDTNNEMAKQLSTLLEQQASLVDAASQGRDLIDRMKAAPVDDNDHEVVVAVPRRVLNNTKASASEMFQSDKRIFKELNSVHDTVQNQKRAATAAADANMTMNMDSSMMDTSLMME